MSDAMFQSNVNPFAWPRMTLILCLAFHVGIWMAIGHANEPNGKPNVVLILADDLGWTDLACYGSDFYETPALDRLASQGMRFLQNYSACTVCSPTRAALMTGKYPARLRITDWIPGAMPDNPRLLVPDWQKQLPLEETTIAEIFRSAGYATASIGKWHLGNESHYPEVHGFDINIAGTFRPEPPSFLAPWKIPTLAEGQNGEYLTDRLAQEATSFIEHNAKHPFFLYLPHFAVHTPIQGRPDLVQKYRRKLTANHRHRNIQYAAMIESLDEAVGKVLDKLDEKNLTKNTIVIFTSDNGGRITQATTDNFPLRFGKASAYEGGVRVPLIVRWPGVAAPGSVTNTPSITMDLFVTLVNQVREHATLAGQAFMNDGVDLQGVIAGKAVLQRKDLFWHYPHHQHYQLGGTMPYAAIRSGDFKLIEFYNDLTVELYNLSDDISEGRDLSKQEPNRVAELRDRLHQWQRSVDAQFATSNPNYDPSRPEYTPKPRPSKP